MTWKPLWTCDVECELLRRVVMAGYYRESGQTYPKVGEAHWGDPDERGSRWIWAGGGDVVNPLGYQDFPDFPIAEKNDQYAVGRPLPETAS